MPRRMLTTIFFCYALRLVLFPPCFLILSLLRPHCLSFSLFLLAFSISLSHFPCTKLLRSFFDGVGKIPNPCFNTWLIPLQNLLQIKTIVVDGNLLTPIIFLSWQLTLDSNQIFKLLYTKLVSRFRSFSEEKKNNLRVDCLLPSPNSSVVC